MKLLQLFKYYNEKSPQRRFDIATENGWTDKARDILRTEPGVDLTIGLIHAVRGGYQDMFTLLLENGADLFKKGMDYAHTAVVAEKTDMLKLLQKHGVTLYPGLLIAATGSVPMMKYLVDDQKLDIYGIYSAPLEDRYIDVATYYAAEFGRTESLEYLLDKNPNIYGVYRNERMRYMSFGGYLKALPVTVQKEQIPALKIILEHKNTDAWKALDNVLVESVERVKLKPLQAALDILKPKIMEKPALFLELLDVYAEIADSRDHSEKGWSRYSLDRPKITALLRKTAQEIRNHIQITTPTVQTAPRAPTLAA